MSSLSRSSAKFHSRGVFLAICFSLVSSFYCLPSICALAASAKQHAVAALSPVSPLFSSSPAASPPSVRFLVFYLILHPAPFHSVRASPSRFRRRTVGVHLALWMVVGTHLERAAQSAATHKPVSWLSDSSHFPGRRIARRTRAERTINGGFPGSISRDSSSAAVAIDDQPGPDANQCA